MVSGFVVGIMTFLGVALLYLKLPHRVRRFLTRKNVDLFVDIIATITTYFSLSAVSGSFSALVACGTLDLLISAGLHYDKKHYWQEANGENSSWTKNLFSKAQTLMQKK